MQESISSIISSSHLGRCKFFNNKQFKQIFLSLYSVFNHRLNFDIGVLNKNVIFIKIEPKPVYKSLKFMRRLIYTLLCHCVIGTTCKTPFKFQWWWGAWLGNGRGVYTGVSVLYVWGQRIHQSTDREPQHFWFGSGDWAPTVHTAGKERQLLSLRLIETLADSTSSISWFGKSSIPCWIITHMLNQYMCFSLLPVSII